MRTWTEDQSIAYLRRHEVWERPAALAVLAEVEIARPPDWDREAQRVVPPMTYDEGCFVCLSLARRLYWHHVVWVSHGGSNDRWNLVKLCHEHHRGVHPWLPPSTTWEERGFVSMMDITSRMLDKVADAGSFAVLNRNAIRRE